MSNTATITNFGLQTGSGRTLYATWSWSKEHTDKYEVKWTYFTGDGVEFIGSSSTTTEKQSTYSIPTNAKSVSFCVKPVSETYTASNKSSGKSSSSGTTSTTLSYWTANWSTKKTYYVASLPPTVPSLESPEIIKKYTMRLSANNVATDTEKIEFQVVQNDLKIYYTGTAQVHMASASHQFSIEAGYRYKVRARAVRQGIYSDWSEYSSNVETVPKAPESITELKTLTKTSISISWSEVTTATSYTIEYTDHKEYFDVTTSTTTVTVNNGTTFTLVGLETGHEYFFRVKATNDAGDSGYTELKSIVVGKKPTAPTTWSNSSSTTVGEDVNLYWIHNSVDGSSQTYAELELTINGSTTSLSIKNTTDEDLKDKTSIYKVSTTQYTDGTVILWRVRTRGVLDDFSDWSIQRTVNVYAPPTLSVTAPTTVSSYPVQVIATAGPATQKPVGFNLTITALSSYETVDEFGQVKMVSNGETVYSKYFDIQTNLSVSLTPADVTLENNIRYRLSCTAAMNSGLSKTGTVDMTVGWANADCYPNAEIAYDEDTYTATIGPYCTNEAGSRLTDWTLAVYRRTYDGDFIEIASDIPSKSRTYVKDPHPSLDYARYRIVAIHNTTGEIEYYDVPGLPIGEAGIIMQWNEEWTNRDDGSPEALDKHVWSGSLLRLPYNVDVSNTLAPDVNLVKYIGRENPVSYYGTHKGETSSWSCMIPAYDEETIYALRRLSAWMGDVYVREPSGIGYWAHVTVSMSINHLEVAHTVSFSITRVEGGI